MTREKPSKWDKISILIAVFSLGFSVVFGGVSAYYLIYRPFPQNPAPEILYSSSTKIVPQGSLDHFFISAPIPVNNDKSIAILFTFNPQNSSIDVRKIVVGYY